MMFLLSIDLVLSVTQNPMFINSNPRIIKDTNCEYDKKTDLNSSDKSYFLIDEFDTNTSLSSIKLSSSSTNECQLLYLSESSFIDKNNSNVEDSNNSSDEIIKSKEDIEKSEKNLLLDKNSKNIIGIYNFSYFYNHSIIILKSVKNFIESFFNY
ncbi:hypothetical protein HERIO_854 [Hepatospora eriocheir]|uniref:Uncharacterized protein n=1 Tax=Hepatospora eriocheir TaxID=1081669 RepID=A0A1X0QC30_9MICR|nr:hypothetical protein HERIO_854 [Hepatospora eriocheir]